ncbi:unnamed protein product [Arabidopsis thaliana]|uniref:(thale cress) hypothetical protein n=1 Tax=Arabidopsis thaliana TaxID=3702 RepID=A0A7G2FBS5_ARATH|nr:unnamed protein product [Arabidopsis thaliana]
MGEKRRTTSKTLAKNNKRKGPYLPNSILKIIANEKRPLYEYEEGVPEEESKKNNRYDRDETVESNDDDEAEGDDDRHTRMLQGLTGMPSAAFQVFFFVYIRRDMPVEDLLAPLEGKPWFNDLCKRINGCGKILSLLFMHLCISQNEKDWKGKL